MRAIVMAGGFARRMWPLTKDMPKPLLKVGGKPILQWIIEKLERTPEIDRIIISTNSKFEEQFSECLRGLPPGKETKVVVEPSEREEEKLGAIGALRFLIEQEKIEEDVLVVAGDNMFDFLLSDLLDFYKKKKAPVVAFYDLGDYEAATRFGVASLDDEGKVVRFEEKPERPESTLVSTGCYVFPKESLQKISEYLESGHNKDAPGHFVKWLSENNHVFGFRFKGKWFDIGSFESLMEAEEHYSGKAA